MKFDVLAGGDPIASTEFGITSYNTSGDNQEDSTKRNTFMDGSVEYLKYGSRKEQLATIVIKFMSDAERVSLTNFCIANAGLKINVVEDYDDEKIFTEVWIPTDYYCYLVSTTGMQEEDFSINRELNTATMTLALSGENSADELNSEGDSLIDVMFTVDTLNAWLTETMDYIQDSEPVGSDGEYWWDSDGYLLYLKVTGTWTEQTPDVKSHLLILNNNGLWEYNGTIWESLKTIAANDANYGWKDGKFYWSTYADIDADPAATPAIGNNHVSGLITLGSTKFPSMSIDINEGPNVMYKTGFSLAVRNNDKFWNYVVTNEISLFGATVTMESYYKTSAGVVTVKTERTGENRTNSFSYTDYKFQVEPFLLNKRGKFPDRTMQLTDSRYSNLKQNEIGKSPYVTYGKWTDDEPAALQDVSFESDTLKISKLLQGITTPDQTTVTAKIDTGDNTHILLNHTAGSDARYTISDADLVKINSGNYAVYIIYDDQTDSENNAESRKIESVSIVSDDYVIVLLEAFTTAPGALTTVIIQILSKTYQFQMNDGGENHTDLSGGFGEPSDDVTGTKTIRIQHLSESGKELVFIPSTDFEENTEKNKISLDPRTAIDTSKIDTYTTTEKLVPPVVSQKPQLTGRIEITYDGNDYVRFGSRNTSANAQASPLSFEQVSRPIWGFIKQFADFYDNSNPWYSDRQETALMNNTYIEEAAYIRQLVYPIDHNNDSVFLDKTDVRFGMNLRIQFMLKIFQSYGELDIEHYRHYPAGFKLILKFRTTAGTYITDDDWEYDFEDYELGAEKRANNEGDIYDNGTNNMVGNIRINNLPDGDVVNGGFKQTNSTLKKNFDYVIRGIGSIADMTDRNPSSQEFNLLFGDYVWVDRFSATPFGILYSVQKDESDDNVNVLVAVDPQPSPGDKLMLLYDPHLVSANRGREFAVYEVLDTTPKTISLLTDGTDYDSLPVFKGRDIFDISKLFIEETWPVVTQAEIWMISKDYSNNPVYFQGDGSTPGTGNVNMWLKTRVISQAQPTLYYIETMETVDRPTFSAVEGRVLTSCGDYQSPECIIRDILDSDTMYNGRYNLASLQSLLAFNTRAGWKWRKQFTSVKKSENVLKEILTNLWAVAIINEDDEIVFKSLIPDDYSLGSPSKIYLESTILENSITNPKFRKSGDIYQNYELAFNYFAPSEFSSALKTHRSEDNIDETSTREELARLCKTSRILYNIYNTYKEEFNYHYDGDILPFSEYVVKHFVLNAWDMRFKISITEVLTSIDPDFMDYIAIKSDHPTNNETLNGFVNFYRADFDKGYAEIGLFILKPPGQFGGICDPFNDAKNTDRDITGWTDLNGKINSAGSTGRTIGSYYQKDAGTSPRNISC